VVWPIQACLLALLLIVSTLVSSCTSADKQSERERSAASLVGSLLIDVSTRDDVHYDYQLVLPDGHPAEIYTGRGQVGEQYGVAFRDRRGRALDLGGTWCSYSRDDKYVACFSPGTNGVVEIIDVHRNRSISRLNMVCDVADVAWSPESDKFALLCSDDAYGISLWELLPALFGHAVVYRTFSVEIYNPNGDLLLRRGGLWNLREARAYGGILWVPPIPRGSEGR
jgi:WD40 repeat protein